MRNLLRLALVLATCAAWIAPVGGGSAAADPGPGYFATDNVEWLGNIPLNTDSAGARIVGDHLYVTEDRGLTIYDITEPELPKPVGFHPLPQTPYYTEEDVDTNGEILLIGSYGDLTRNVQPSNNLFVFDVSNKSVPTLIGSVQGADAHTISCILDCTWAYGSNGVIVDLRDPTAPEVAGNWRTAAGVPGTHDVTEVAPGIVVTSSNPLYILDVSEDPTKPEVVLTTAPPDGRFLHGNLWPHGGTDRFLLAGGETIGDCNTTDAGSFMVFEQVRDPETDELIGFEMTDDHRVTTGDWEDGNSPYDQYCAHWFTTHPTYRDGGLVAMGWYEHGTRFLNVTDEGQIEEVGWFLPLGGSTSAAYWATDEILYAVDYQRGIDILRFSGEPSDDVRFVPGTGPLPGTEEAVAGPPRFDAVRSESMPFVCPIPAGVRVG